MAKYVPDDIQPSRVSFYVNLAFRDVANRLPAVEFERMAYSSTSSGNPVLFLPGDCERVLNVSITTAVTGVDGQGLRQTNVWDFDAQSAGTQSGVPDRFLSYATWLEFYPSPNSSYSLQMRYMARYSDLTNPASVPSVDTRYHTAGLFRTVEMLALRKGDAAMAGMMHGRYESELMAQPSALAQRQHDRLGFSATLKFKED